MQKSWTGPAVAGLLVLAISVFLLLNLETPRPAAPASTAAPETAQPAPANPPEAKPSLAGTGAPIREYPIGDEVEQNHIRVAAVWLAAVTMDNMPTDPTSHPIHIEADIKALENNPNGFAKDEKVDYLKVGYKLVPTQGGAPVAAGDLVPMMARDGFHYGATIAMPAPGDYKLVYDISPPVGLGRHSDPATGVAPWWNPFQVSFDWTIESTTAVSLR